jgi:hypothetical protein
MKRLLFMGLALVAATVAAQENAETPDDTLDLTMVLMPEGATLPDAVTRVIELPAAAVAASEAAAANAAPGLDTANEAREQGRERAQQSREDAVRGPPEWAGGPGGRGREGGPDLPDTGRGNRPDDAGPPETPAPPGD